MSAPSLSNFTSQLRAKNISRPNLYYVEIIPPNIINNSEFSIDNNLVSMWCSGAMTPQTTILTRDDYLEAGTRRKFAYDQDYQNLTLHFYLDQDFEIQRFFDLWKQAIVPQRRCFGYPADYTANLLNLYIINQDDVATYKYEYSRIFPKSINSIDLNYASGTSISTLAIDFVFEEVYYSSIKNGKTIATSKPTVDTNISSNLTSIKNEEYRQQFFDSIISGNGGDFGGGGASGYWGE